MATPQFLDDEAFKCLRAGELDRYRQLVAGRSEIDLRGADLRGTDFRHVDLGKVKLTGAYLRDADLRGKDLRHLDLEGCSLRNARIGGTFFPDALTAEEIRLSVEHGTRLRVRQR